MNRNLQINGVQNTNAVREAIEELDEHGVQGLDAGFRRQKSSAQLLGDDSSII